ncbi:MAG: hypothetical protein HY791_14255 [Deltaproteobacteria bacterium]|nr:hypothetical protein [Deltaproteobacteria bacterium]
MSQKQRRETPEEKAEPAVDVFKALAKATRGLAFGPEFFLHWLGAFVRNQCPDPAAGLPKVHIHLASGDILDLCHIIGAAPCWIAVAVDEGAGPDGRQMRTELVPYQSIVRITIRNPDEGTPTIGFGGEPVRRVISAEEVLVRAAG